MRSIAASGAVCLLLGASTASAGGASVFEDFESFNPATTVGDPISLGAAPDRATLSGDAFAGAVGIGQLYFSGVRAWMVNGDGVGVIDFETNASDVSFWARTRSGADGDTLLTALNDGGGVIETQTVVSGDDFKLFAFSGSIDRITVQNMATADMMSIDDLRYTTVPGPASAAVVALLGGAGLARRRRR